MKLQLNGEAIEVLSPTIHDLLVDRGIDPTQPGIAVALNDEVVLRSEWGSRALHDGDELELVTAMQGG
jgi:sulfur carrier protein